MFARRISHYPGNWHLVTESNGLTLEYIEALQPRYVFFPHWSHRVPVEILKATECVCFHETDLPYGRGGSPLQNLIAQGHRDTVVCAFQMEEDMDSGPIYLKRALSLEGIAEEIYLRASGIVADMILEIVTRQPTPRVQQGETMVFERRKPEQSLIPTELKEMGEIFDHLRMLDAEGYPKAFIDHGGFRYEFLRPALRTNEIWADVRITPITEES